MYSFWVIVISITTILISHKVFREQLVKIEGSSRSTSSTLILCSSIAEEKHSIRNILSIFWTTGALTCFKNCDAFNVVNLLVCEISIRFFYTILLFWKLSEVSRHCYAQCSRGIVHESSSLDNTRLESTLWSTHLANPSSMYLSHWM